MMSTGNESRSNSRISGRTRGNSRQYSLRSKSESSAISNTKEDIFITPSKSSCTPRPTTPSTPSSKICTVCKGLDEFRNLKFKDTLAEFTNKIDIFKDLTKSFNENNSTLNHALDTIKHFFLHLKPDEINDKFSKMDGSLQALSSKAAYLPDVAYFDDKLKAMEADLISLNSRSIAKLESKLDSLESRFPDLACIGRKLSALETKISDLDIKAGASGVSRPDFAEFGAKLDSIGEIVDSKIGGMDILPNSFNSLTSQISNLESLCAQLNSRSHPSSGTSIHSTSMASPTPNIVNHSSQITNSRIPSPKTCIIIGDSNTKHIKLEDDHLDSYRVATYLIEDIDPNLCVGFKKIWIHVGTNNIKSIRCSNSDDIHRHFNTLMHKLKAIHSICPHSKIIVSPIPPTAIEVLNRRAIMFNNLLFSHRSFFTTLNLNIFCGSDGKLMDIYRCYNNRQDRIHLGSLGIKILTSKVKHCLSLSHIDHRSYASAIRQY